MAERPDPLHDSAAVHIISGLLCLRGVGSDPALAGGEREL